MEGTSIPRLFPIIGIANALNEEDIPTFLGKQWYNATLFRVLKNPAYIGRTYYRRTEATYVRDPNRDRRRRHVTERARDEWVEIEGATEAIISEELFERVQERLRDPERLRMGHRTHTYGLAGHIRCALCGASMVGQTLRPNYRYYRCRRSFAGPKHDRCSARYLRADLIEGAVRGGVAKVLSAPEIIKIELERLSLVADSSPTVDDALALVEAERKDSSRATSPAKSKTMPSNRS